MSDIQPGILCEIEKRVKVLETAEEILAKKLDRLDGEFEKIKEFEAKLDGLFSRMARLENFVGGEPPPVSKVKEVWNFASALSKQIISYKESFDVLRDRVFSLEDSLDRRFPFLDKQIANLQVDLRKLENPHEDAPEKYEDVLSSLRYYLPDIVSQIRALYRDLQDAWRS